MGWLYLLREVGALDAGPRLARALPLDQLARGDAQPLLRVATAWLPAGAAAGWALAGGSGWGLVGRTGALAALASVLLFGTGAVSDALAVSQPGPGALGDQFAHEGIWIEIIFVVIGSLPIRPAARGPARARGAEAAATQR